MTISLNSKFIIGHYIYCTQERFLYLDGEPIHIEPKMAELLDYLLLHTERYVPLQELHDKVWVGRIVTDTAVRRVISRLRALVEADPSKPVIIKSLPKRGYRLFSTPASAELANKHLETSIKTTPDTDLTEALMASLSAEQASTKPTDTFQEPSLTDMPVAAAPRKDLHKETVEGRIVSGVSKSTSSASKLMLVILNISLVLAACIGAFYLINQPKHLKPHVDKVENGAQTTELVLSHFESLPLNSRLLAISKDGQLAFYEQNREDGSYDLFLHKVKQGKQWLLTNKHISAGYAAFVENDTAILLSFNSGTATEGSLQLWHLNEAKQVSRKRLLILDIQGTTSIILGGQLNSAFVAITTVIDDIAKSEFHLLRWDEETLVEKKKITSTYNSLSMDIQGSLSKDNKYLAYVRKTLLDHEQEIQILELATGKVIKRIPWRQETRALAWQDSETLLVLNKQNLTSINIDTDSKAELFVHLNSHYWQMYLLNNKIYIYKREALSQRYIELIMNEGVPHTILRERAANSVSVNISKYDSKQWYEITKEGDKYHLALINFENPEQDNKLFSSSEYFVLLDESLKGNLLLKVGDRVGVLKSNGEINFINSEQQILDDAVFDRDGVNIIYSQINDNLWSVYLFDVNSKESRFIRQGYKSTRVSEELYLFWREDGELFKAKTLTGELTSLSVTTNLFLPPTWNVAYPYLYWVDYIASKLVLNKHNLEDCSNEQLEVYFFYNNQLSLNKKGNSLMLNGFSDISSNIYFIDKVDVNARW